MRQLAHDPRLACRLRVDSLAVVAEMRQLAVDPRLACRLLVDSPAVVAELRPLAHKRDMPLGEVAVKLGKHPSTIRKWARARLHGFAISGHAGREMIVRLPDFPCLWAI
jgi:hypothetical protein